MIALTRASALRSLPRLLEQRAGERTLQRLLAAEGVPLQIADHPDAMIPVRAVTALYERAAQALGDRTFGLELGQAAALSDYGFYMDYCVTAPTLGEALKRTVRAKRYHQPEAGMWLHGDRNLAIWSYAAPVQRPHAQHADHLIGPFCQLVRAFAGPDWMPERVVLNYPRDADSSLVEDKLACPVHFGASAVSITLDARLLGLKRRTSDGETRQITLPDVAARAAVPEARDCVNSILSIVLLRLLDGHSDIDGTARMAGLGVQTLQRRLRTEGVAYREVVNTARAARGKALLRESGQSVMEIGLSLGYSDYANFARAFRRWTGRSPSAYRRQTS